MLKVGIIGFGGMGHCHAAAYARRAGVKLVAVADIDPSRLQGASMSLNIGATAAFDMRDVRTYTSAEAMLAREQLDLVSVCLPTDLHAEYTIKALRSGVHVLCEKPMSPTLREADAMIAAAERAGRRLMIAQCLRFWPCYEKLAEVYRGGTYGRLLMLSMRRFGGAPSWGKGGRRSWFMDGRRSGGALLDLHIHDADFIQHLLGMPAAVSATGRTHLTGRIDNAVTQYIYPGGPVVMAETSWSYHGGFCMAFMALFEKATLEMGYKGPELRLCRVGKDTANVKLAPGAGYDREIDYFIRCIRQGKAPERCTPQSTRATLRMALAEERSALRGGAPVRLNP